MSNTDIDEFSAMLSGYKNAEEYKNNMQAILNSLPKIIITKVHNADDYAFARKCQSALTALECYLFNSGIKEHQEQVFNQKDVVFKAIAAYNRRFHIKDQYVRTMARYLLWNYSYRDENLNSILKFLNENGALRRKLSTSGSCQLYVVGLHLKVGDNVFSVDSRGHEHRRYLSTSANQAFPAHFDNTRLSSIDQNIINEVPLIDDDFYSITYVGDGKGCARTIGLNYKEKEYILSNFMNK